MSAGPVVGLYKVRVEDPTSGKDRKFRLLLFAELPDRLHGEILSPVGKTVMIFDGGGGRLAVSLPRERQAFVGQGDPVAMERVFGLALSLESLTRSLLLGEALDSEIRVERTGGEASAMPELLRISTVERSLELQLKSLQRLRVPAESLGTGQPPEGLELRPLDDLEIELLPVETRGAE